MTTFYLDPVGGSDAADGTTFANRWKTIGSGATAARIAPGDVIRIMRSAQPTLLDSSASWTNNSATVTLSGAVTANITTCESNWTASANVTASTNTSFDKQGTYCIALAIGASFTTGKAAYFATGSLDLSGYQQVSFWVRVSVALAASKLSLRLCTDTTGDTSVHTVAIPALVAGVWSPVTVDLATNLNAAIQSICLYGDADPGTVTVYLDNIIACKASSSDDSLTLNSLIGKKWNLSWAGSTSYAQYDIVRPTVPNRTGFIYRKTDSGSDTSGGSEPTWPVELGATVTDGTITWECYDIEETWHGIKSINGTTVLLDTYTEATTGVAMGYSGATESVATYKREPIVSRNTTTTMSVLGQAQEAGTAENKITYSGGWNTTDMSTQDGETWIDGGGTGYGFYTLVESLAVTNFNVTRCAVGIYFYDSCGTLSYCHANNCDGGIYFTGTNIARSALKATGIVASHCYSYGIAAGAFADVERFRADSTSLANAGCGISGGSAYAAPSFWNFGTLKNNDDGAINAQGTINARFRNITTAGNGYTFGQADGALPADFMLHNCSLGDTTLISANALDMGTRLLVSKYGKTANDHRIFCTPLGDEGIYSDASQRHTASGISWRFDATNPVFSESPLRLVIGRVLCAASTAKTVTIWSRRDNTNIRGRLVVRGGQIAGVPAEVAVALEPSVNTWTQSGDLQFTPTEAGVVEIEVQVTSIGSADYQLWVDDLAVS